VSGGVWGHDHGFGLMVGGSVAAFRRAVTDETGFEQIRGYAEDSGEGRWTVEEAVATATPAPVITAVLYARFASRQEDPLAMRVVAALRQQFGGHGVRP
jgi:6-phosphogluconate dehydrogenase